MKASSGETVSLVWFHFIDIDLHSQWNFFTGPDPTHGLVNYQNQGDAQSKTLAYLDGDTVVLAVDDITTLQPGQNRDS